MARTATEFPNAPQATPSASTEVQSAWCSSRSGCQAGGSVAGEPRHLAHHDGPLVPARRHGDQVLARGRRSFSTGARSLSGTARPRANAFSRCRFGRSYRRFSCRRVVAEGPARHPGRFAEPRHPGAVEASFGEQFGRRAQYAIPSGLPRPDRLPQPSELAFPRRWARIRRARAERHAGRFRSVVGNCSLVAGHLCRKVVPIGLYA